MVLCWRRENARGRENRNDDDKYAYTGCYTKGGSNCVAVTDWLPVTRPTGELRPLRMGSGMLARLLPVVGDGRTEGAVGVDGAA